MNFDLLWIGFLIFSLFWIYAEVSKWLFHRKSQTTQSFQLTADEENEWRRGVKTYHAAEQKIQTLEREIRYLEGQGAGLRKNKKGKFDNRSALGKKLNKSINAAQVEKLRRNGDLNRVQATIDKLHGLELIRALPWIESESRRVSARIFTTLYVCTCIALLTLNVDMGVLIKISIILALISGYYLTRRYFKNIILKKLGY